MTESKHPRRAARGFALAAALAAFVGFGFTLTRAWANYREYRAMLPTDPSAAELYLDGALMWGAVCALALVAGTILAWLASDEPGKRVPENPT